jgi:hypothetical protein
VVNRGSVRLLAGLPPVGHPDIDAREPPVLAPTDCWALHRGRCYVVDAHERPMSCRHAQHQTGDSICVPMSVLGEPVGCST